MTDSISKTQDMLARHHGDGTAFAELMEETFLGRFNDDFWALWEQRIEPVMSAQPTVIDLGTGPATFIKVLAKRYPQARAIGIECAPYMLDAVGVLPKNAEIMMADLQDPQFSLEDNCVDVAVASVVVHEMHQPVKSFLEVARVLKPGGMFYILDWVRAPLEQYLEDSDLAVFDKTTDTEKLEDLFIHFSEHNRFSIADLAFMLTCCGFDVIVNEALQAGRKARLLARKTG